MRRSDKSELMKAFAAYAAQKDPSVNNVYIDLLDLVDVTEPEQKRRITVSMSPSAYRLITSVDAIAWDNHGPHGTLWESAPRQVFALYLSSIDYAIALLDAGRQKGLRYSVCHLPMEHGFKGPEEAFGAE